MNPTPMNALSNEQLLSRTSKTLFVKGAIAQTPFRDSSLS